MLMKTSVAALSFLYIKLVIACSIILFLYVNRESNKLLKKEFKMSCGKYINYCIRPKTFSRIPHYIPSLKMLYYAIWNKIFDLAYMKIFVGEENFWFRVLKSLKKIEMLKSLIYLFLGFNRFIIKIFIELFKFNNKNIEEYLFRNFNNPWDDRIIIKINNNWEINGSTQKIIKDIEGILERKISHGNFQFLKPHLYLKIEMFRGKLIEIDKQYLCYIGEFINIKNKIQHSTFICISKSDLAYQTDFLKAIKKNDYGRTAVIRKYEGDDKKSTLFPIKESDMKPLADPELESCVKQMYGAGIHGYDHENVSIKFQEQIKEIKGLSLEWQEFLEEIGVSSMHSKELFEKLLNEII